MSDSDVVAQNATQYFDISIWQFLSVLLVGGRVDIIADDIGRDIPQLLATLERLKTTILEIVPSQMRAMLEVVEAAGAARPDLSALRWLIVNGEVLPPELCRKWLTLYPSASLINAYGHTECSDDETHYAIRRPPARDVSAVPIGKPLANLRLYLLDSALSPVPTGVPGEVYVGGIGVGRGYLNDPARTAQTYVPDLFSNAPGARLYKTGDLARHVAGGNLEFVNRIDFQVKVRGFRIELGEIEAVLRQHAAVREAVALVREDEGEQPRLVAYIELRPGVAPTTSDLHNFLRERLPDYMVPSAFVMLEQIPLNQNGKVDRHALPVPGGLRPDLSEQFAPPRTPVEELIAEIWIDLLGIECVGVRDNFFELGGHSLLATQVISRIREAFEVELPLSKLFESPTVEGLSLEVTKAQLGEMNQEEMAQIIDEMETLPGHSLDSRASTDVRSIRWEDGV
jgi:acyl-coenzyme A synthetase/AMP-(fatty) acid ligase/acyl carrier protein